MNAGSILNKGAGFLFLARAFLLEDYINWYRNVLVFECVTVSSILIKTGGIFKAKTRPPVHFPLSDGNSSSRDPWGAYDVVCL